VITGGARAEGEGYCIQPTVIADIAPTARVFPRKEIFGPVLAVVQGQRLRRRAGYREQYGIRSPRAQSTRPSDEKIERAKT